MCLTLRLFQKVADVHHVCLRSRVRGDTLLRGQRVLTVGARSLGLCCRLFAKCAVCLPMYGSRFDCMTQIWDCLSLYAPEWREILRIWEMTIMKKDFSCVKWNWLSCS
ncbi:hypothetical protein SRHO_G00053670 [Serrasalmus rhombeus]